MLRGLFARLTAEPRAGGIAFDALVAEARRPHWYVEGRVPDTVDGRFAVLATVVALATVHLDRLGRTESSVALAEGFIAAMDAEHRQMGVGDPAVGKTVRRLVGALAGRVELWRTATGGGEWRSGARRSLYRDSPVADDALDHGAERLHDLWRRLSEGAFE